MTRPEAPQQQPCRTSSLRRTGQTAVEAAYLPEGLSPEQGYRRLPVRLPIAGGPTLHAEAELYSRDGAAGSEWFAALVLVDGDLRAICAVYEVHPEGGRLDWLRDEPVLWAALRREVSWLTLPTP